MTAIIKRTTLKVRNMEKSLIFYEKVLGMKNIMTMKLRSLVSCYQVEKPEI